MSVGVDGEGFLGVFGVLAISEDENGVLNPGFQFIDARDNSVIYQRVLEARYGPNDVPEPSTPEPSSSFTNNSRLNLVTFAFSVLARAGQSARFCKISAFTDSNQQLTKSVFSNLAV